MDLLTFISSVQVREVSATVVLVAAVIALLTGRIVPLPTHKRELLQATSDRDEWRRAAEKQGDANTKLLQQNSNLLAGVRIADKFYRDFIPSPDEHTTPTSEVPHVGS